MLRVAEQPSGKTGETTNDAYRDNRRKLYFCVRAAEEQIEDPPMGNITVG